TAALSSSVHLFNTATVTTEFFTLSLHDALPIYIISVDGGVVLNGYISDSAYTFSVGAVSAEVEQLLRVTKESLDKGVEQAVVGRSEEHTSELQSRENLVCRLLLEKKKTVKKGNR